MTAETPNSTTSTPDQPPHLGLANLMTRAFLGEDLGPVGAELLSRAQNNPADANALMDLSIILQLRGDPQNGLAIQAQALALQQFYDIPAKRPGGPRILAIKGPGEVMWNTPLEFLVEDSDINLDMLYLAPELPVPEGVPDHDVLMIAVAQCDRNRALLASLADLAREWPRPIINRPERIAQLTRDNVCHMLGDIPGVIMPLSVRCDRVTLEALAQGEINLRELLSDADFPIIVRPVDSHAGRGLDRADDPAALARYLQQSPADQFYISRFVDYRQADGRYRKARVVVIDGQPFVAHMAISDHWMIHYLNAGMAEDAAKRAEEARFMETFDAEFAARHRPALAAVTERLGLDYYALDCAETADGQLLIFEADSAMVVHAMDPEDDFPYKKVQMRKVFDAFRAMIAKRQSAAQS